MTHDHALHLYGALAAFFTGGGFMRFLNYVSHCLPPLPPGAGFFQTLLYNLVSGASGHDPKNNIVGTDNHTETGSK